MTYRSGIMKRCYAVVLLLCLVDQAGLAQTFFEYDQAGNRIRRSYIPVPDLSPSTDIDNLNFGVNSGPRDFVLNLYEVNNLPTSGSITFNINKPTAFSITYPTTNVTANVTIAGNPVVENSNWNFSETPNFIVVTSKAGVGIAAGGQATIGFRIMRKPNVLNYTLQNLTISIGDGAGGELNPTNNLVVTRIVTNN